VAQDRLGGGWVNEVVIKCMATYMKDSMKVVKTVRCIVDTPMGRA
jgi:hypothetical protein